MKIMTFRLGNTVHAVEISTVDAVARQEEVATRREWNQLPRVDLAALLGYGDREATKGREAVLVVRSGERRAVVEVDRTGEVLDVPSSALKDTPYPFGSRLLRGVIEHEDRVMPLLDGAALVDQAGPAVAEEAT